MPRYAWEVAQTILTPGIHTIVRGSMGATPNACMLTASHGGTGSRISIGASTASRRWYSGAFREHLFTTADTDGRSRHSLNKVGNDFFYFGGTTASSLNVSDIHKNGTVIANLPSALRFGRSIAVGTDIYYVGGQDSGGTQATVYKLDTLTNALTTLAPMPGPLTAPGVVHSGNFIYVFGGADAFGNPQSTVFRYDIAANSWSTLPPLPGPMADCFATRSGTDVYVSSYEGYLSAAVYRYDLTTNTSSANLVTTPDASRPPAFIFAATATELLYVILDDLTGAIYTSPLNNASFSAMVYKRPMPVSLDYTSALHWDGTDLHVHGGFNRDWATPDRITYSYNLASDTWQSGARFRSSTGSRSEIFQGTFSSTSLDWIKIFNPTGASTLKFRGFTAGGVIVEYTGVTPLTVSATFWGGDTQAYIPISIATETLPFAPRIGLSANCLPPCDLTTEAEYFHLSVGYANQRPAAVNSECFSINHAFTTASRRVDYSQSRLGALVFNTTQVRRFDRGLTISPNTTFGSYNRAVTNYDCCLILDAPFNRNQHTTAAAINVNTLGYTPGAAIFMASPQVTTGNSASGDYLSYGNSLGITGVTLSNFGASSTFQGLTSAAPAVAIQTNGYTIAATASSKNVIALTWPSDTFVAPVAAYSGHSYCT